MNRKQVIITVVVSVVLAVLVYLQYRQWQQFDWKKLMATRGIAWGSVLLAVALIYLADFLRGIRWKIFLRPSFPNVDWKTLIAPQFVGFAGLAVLGRPGELSRPYLIARKINATFASQMAIWVVERMFDTGAVIVILLLDIFFAPSLRTIHHYEQFRKAGFIIAGLFGLLVVFILAIWFYGPALAAWICRRLSPWPVLGSRIEKHLRTFSEGLDTVHNSVSFLQVTLLSFAVWTLVLLSYRQVTHAYPAETGLSQLGIPQVVLLMGASMIGAVLQLPMVGGGSQLATIKVLNSVFGISPELAVSCGILLWLVTFMAVAPLGLALAHREHVSLRAVSHEAEDEARSAGKV